MLSNFTYSIPTKIEFGNGNINKLPETVTELKGNKAFIVGDPGVIKAGIIEKVITSLKKTIPHVVFSEIEADPTVESVEAGARRAKEESCDIVIGVGGGSSLDTAKTIGLLLNNSGGVKDYVGLEKVPQKSAPTIAIPTTAGTGSELTMFSVLSDKKEKVKLSIASKHNCPDVAICDPELTLTLPPAITAATGMDALTHAIESYVNKNTQPISEGMAIQSISLIHENLRLAVVQGENQKARYSMLLASLMAAMAFNSTRLGISHALAIPLGARFNIPHGTVNAILLPEVMDYNLIGATDKFSIIAEIFGEKTNDMTKREAASKAVFAVKNLKEEVGINYGLKDYGVKEEDLNLIAEEAMQSGNIGVNPRKPTLEDLKNICRSVM